MTTAATDSLDILFQEAVTFHAEPLWPRLGELSPPAPRAKAQPYVWRYETMRPFCERAARLVGTELAERRVFMLVNPAMTAPHTTDTLYAGLQTILPGEVARAHRHTPFAIRFIIEGENAFTAVEGEKVMMERGDLVLTPAWEWHDHGNEGTRPMIWMDGLDLPVWKAVPAIFTEHYPEQRYPSEHARGPSIRRYPWAEIEAQLVAQPGPTAEARYRHRQTGGEISATCGAAAIRIDAGARTPRKRETTSAVIHVYEGTGRSLIGDTELRWTPGDCVAVPAWTPVVHEADPGADVRLFRFDDLPLLTALEAYRCDEGDAA